MHYIESPLVVPPWKGSLSWVEKHSPELSACPKQNASTSSRTSSPPTDFDFEKAPLFEPVRAKAPSDSVRACG